MIRNYQIIEKIGKGTFGIVYKVKKFNDPFIYVIKQISLEGLTDFQINQVYSEVKILSLIKSKYVVKYYESFLEDDNLNIVMEYCDNGDLNNYLNEQKKKNKPLKEDLIWKIFIKITLGLTTIHKMKILHRDLKSLNIFLKKDMEIKIGDLGVAKELNQASFANTIIGTPYYLSPEMCEDKPYNQKSDVWALGVILYELCTFRHPFTAGNHAALILKIMNANPAPILACYSSSLQKIVNCLLEKKIEKRPNCLDILNMKIIAEKAKMLGLYHEILNICSENDNISNAYYINGNNNNNEPIVNLIPMDSEDILIQSQLVPLHQNNNKIQVKRINNIENQNHNYIYGDKMIKKANQKEYQNDLNIYQIENQKNIFQNNYMNNFDNGINQIPYNYNYYTNNEPNIMNNYNFQNGNHIIYNNNLNNLYNTNFNQNNNIIFNNILINNNPTNDASSINNNINKEQKFMKVTRVYQRPKNTNELGNFIEDRNINDINDSINISVQAPSIDMDRISENINIFPNNSSENKKDIVDNSYNFPSNSEMPMDNLIEEGYPKDNPRNQNSKLIFQINLNEIEKIKTENIPDEKNNNEEKKNNSNSQKKSLTKSNSFIEKDISPIKLITNTQESINIMENIKNLNIDDYNISSKKKEINFESDYKKENSNQKIKKGYKYQKKKLNVGNLTYKRKDKEKIEETEQFNNKEDIEQKLNKTSEFLGSSDIFNLNIEHQDQTAISKYIKSNNLKTSSQDSFSDSDFNLLKESKNDINDPENNKINEQNIPSIDIDEKEDDGNNSK